MPSTTENWSGFDASGVPFWLYICNRNVTERLIKKSVFWNPTMEPVITNLRTGTRIEDHWFWYTQSLSMCFRHDKIKDPQWVDQEENVVICDISHPVDRFILLSSSYLHSSLYMSVFIARGPHKKPFGLTSFHRGTKEVYKFIFLRSENQWLVVVSYDTKYVISKTRDKQVLRNEKPRF